jgi:hypothetical protein
MLGNVIDRVAGASSADGRRVDGAQPRSGHAGATDQPAGERSGRDPALPNR